MCLLSFFPEGVIPIEHRLENGAILNGDGHGWAIAAKGNRLLTGRSMEAEKALGTFMAARRKHPEGPAMFHSRFSTGGKLTTYNVHPFQVGPDARTVMAHNGILFASGKTKSDTRIFAESVMPVQYKRLDRPGVRKALEQRLGGYNKIAVITVNPRYQHQGYLFNEKAGTWADGEWHSNGDYKDRYRVRPGTPARDSWDSWDSWDGSTTPGHGYYAGGYEWTRNPQSGLWSRAPYERNPGTFCEFCGHHTVDLAVGICRKCRSCQDCGMTGEECMCYVPAAVRNGDAEADQCLGCTLDELCCYCQDQLETAVAKDA